MKLPDVVELVHRSSQHPRFNEQGVSAIWCENGNHIATRQKAHRTQKVFFRSPVWPTQPYPTFDQNPNIVEPDYPTKCVAVLFPKGTENRKPVSCPHLSPPKSLNGNPFEPNVPNKMRCCSLPTESRGTRALSASRFENTPSPAPDSRPNPRA